MRKPADPEPVPELPISKLRTTPKPPPEYPRLTENLLRIRSDLGFTQTQVATLSGLSRIGYMNIENGVSNPKPDTLQAIARALACDVPALLAEPVFPDPNVSLLSVVKGILPTVDWWSGLEPEEEWDLVIAEGEYYSITIRRDERSVFILVYFDGEELLSATRVDPTLLIRSLPNTLRHHLTLKEKQVRENVDKDLKHLGLRT